MNGFRRLIFVACLPVVALVGVLTSQDEELRVWKDDTGKHETRASFVALRDNVVELKLEDGKSIEVSLDRLSAADKAYVRKITRPAKAPNQPKRKAGVEPSDRMPDEPNSDLPALDAGGDWTQWRGPNRDGISGETGLLESWPSDGPPEAWRIDGLGGGFSSCAIAGGRLFTMGQFGDETRLIARDATTGDRLWETRVGRGGEGPNCTPTVDGELVFAVSHAGDVLCARADSGQEVWRLNFARDFGGKMMSQWGYSESPLVDGDRVILTPGAPQAAMAAMDKRSGKLIWRAALPQNAGPAGQDGAGYSSIVVSQAQGVKQYIQFVGRGVISVEAESGRFLWGYNRIANGTANIPTPIVSGNFVFCSSGYDDGGSALLEVVGARNQLNAREVWYKPSRDLQNHHGGMILIGQNVYMGHGHNNGFPVCFPLATGRPLWGPDRGAGTGSAAVLYAEGHLYFRYENAVMALVEASPTGYKLKGKFKIGIHHAQSWAHPVIWNGHLYLRDQHELICYDLRKK